MKYFLKILFKTVFISIVIIGLMVLFWQSIIGSRLKRVDAEISKMWNEISDKSLIKDSLILESINSSSCNTNSLKYFVWKKEKTGSQCSLDYSDNEYHINKIYLFLKDSLLNMDFNKNLIQETHIELNSYLKDYNLRVRNFNRKISSVPTYFVARKLKLEKRCFLEIKYGEENKSPKQKLKEINDLFDEMERAHSLR